MFKKQFNPTHVGLMYSYLVVKVDMRNREKPVIKGYDLVDDLLLKCIFAIQFSYTLPLRLVNWSYKPARKVTHMFELSAG